jgi:hypothetical protein
LRASTLTAVATVSVALGLTSCGGNGDEKKTAGPAVTTLPDCAPDATRVALPSAFPQGFPMPSGALVRKARDDGNTMKAVSVAESTPVSTA